MSVKNRPRKGISDHFADHHAGHFGDNECSWIPFSSHAPWGEESADSYVDSAIGELNAQTIAPIVTLLSSISMMGSRMTSLEDRVSRLESGKPSDIRRKNVLHAGPMKWLKDNRAGLIDKYGGEWIAVSEDGVQGHGEDLTNLYAEMANQNAKLTYVHIGRRLPTDAAN